MIQYSHGKHECAWDSDAKKFVCKELGLSADNPDKLASMIDKVATAERRMGNPVKVISWKAGERWELRKPAKLIEGEITMLAKSNRGEGDYTEVFVRVGKERPEKKYLRHWYLDTPENRRGIEAYIDADNHAREAAVKAEQLKDGIPRTTLDELRKLGAVSVEEAVQKQD